ncbi:unnamed protein product [Adineta steineri]|uniref:Uncharacterized protein n=1 Tax=Adineta steineri TaxID=433720 RepID=A0A814B697_9BILA|nr:unnamed protein product [Adineta steineri]
MDYDSSTGKVVLSDGPYMPLSKPFPCTSNPKIQRTRQIHFILNGILLILSVVDLILGITGVKFLNDQGMHIRAYYISQASIWILLNIFGLVVAYKYNRLGLHVFAWLNAVLIAILSILIIIILNLLPILNEFIKTYEGKVDVEFWNHIADAKRGRLGSGSTEYISGWILKLFYEINGNNPEQIMAADIKLDSIHVPVEVENHCTCLKKTCYVLGGFYGVDSTQDHIHKLVMSLAVIEDLTTVEKL